MLSSHLDQDDIHRAKTLDELKPLVKEGGALRTNHWLPLMGLLEDSYMREWRRTKDRLAPSPLVMPVRVRRPVASNPARPTIADKFGEPGFQLRGHLTKEQVGRALKGGPIPKGDVLDQDGRNLSRERFQWLTPYEGRTVDVDWRTIVRSGHANDGWDPERPEWDAAE